MTGRSSLTAVDDEWEELLAKNMATEGLESRRKSRRSKRGWDPLLIVIIVICFGIAIFSGVEIVNLI